MITCSSTATPDQAAHGDGAKGRPQRPAVVSECMSARLYRQPNLHSRRRGIKLPACAGKCPCELNGKANRLRRGSLPSLKRRRDTVGSNPTTGTDGNFNHERV